jgi:hypothetical protein
LSSQHASSAALRRKIATINNSRWATYATAGAASALGCAATAHATIIYSGPINHNFRAPLSQSITGNFPLAQPGESIVLAQLRFPGPGVVSGSARFSLNAMSGAAAGFFAPRFARFYASKLTAGQSIGAAPFVNQSARLAVPPLDCCGYGYAAQWQQPGTGFVGFRFNDGSGIQYGWARINMDGADAGNTFTLIDYAFAGPGEKIRAGQTTESVPESGGSLGLLALGCAGVLAWRARRSAVVEPA